MSTSARVRIGFVAFVAAAVVTVAAAGFYIWLNIQKSAVADVRRGSSPSGMALDLPDFELTEASNRRVTRSDLAGSAWIVDAIFTRCPGPCARMTQEMARLQEELAGSNVKFLSVSVDPEHDTPEVLADYAANYGADRSRWWFVTGSKDEVREFLAVGLRLAVADVPEEEIADNPHGPIVHSTKFVLVDGDAAIRGFYDGLDDESRAALAQDAKKLAGE